MLKMTEVASYATAPGTREGVLNVLYSIIVTPSTDMAGRQGSGVVIADRKVWIPKLFSHEESPLIDQFLDGSL